MEYFASRGTRAGELSLPLLAAAPDVRPLWRKGRRYFLRLYQQAEQGNDHAMYALGKIHLRLNNIPSAMRWFQKSAELGNQYAQYALWKMYLPGEVKDKDAAVHRETTRRRAGHLYPA